MKNLRIRVVSQNFLFLLGMLFMLSGCEHPKITKEAPEANELKTDSKFTVNLQEDHRDGSTWQLKDDFDPAVIGRLGDVWHGNEKGIFFNLMTKAAGQTTLTFVKRKYTDTLDTKHFIIRVVN